MEADIEELILQLRDYYTDGVSTPSGGFLRCEVFNTAANQLQRLLDEIVKLGHDPDAFDAEVRSLKINSDKDTKAHDNAITKERYRVKMMHLMLMGQAIHETIGEDEIGGQVDILIDAALREAEKKQD